jgi:hypothetical protein
VARLIVWQKPHVESKDPEFEAGRYIPGNVISVLDDGADPGSDVRASDWWQIVDVPGKKVDYDYLTAGQPKDADAAKLPRKRWNVVDTSLATVIADGTYAMSALEVSTATVQADYIIDPAIIGADPQVIG